MTNCSREHQHPQDPAQEVRSLDDVHIIFNRLHWKQGIFSAECYDRNSPSEVCKTFSEEPADDIVPAIANIVTQEDQGAASTGDGLLISRSQIERKLLFSLIRVGAMRTRISIAPTAIRSSGVITLFLLLRPSPTNGASELQRNLLHVISQPFDIFPRIAEEFLPYDPDPCWLVRRHFAQPYAERWPLLTELSRKSFPYKFIQLQVPLVSPDNCALRLI